MCAFSRQGCCRGKEEKSLLSLCASFFLSNSFPLLHVVRIFFLHRKQKRELGVKERYGEVEN